MYPRNAASPERISIGAVVQISDGAVQTSGVTVRILPAGGAEGDGAGTTAYSTDGVVLYTPTQAETNYASFVLIAKKAGCFPVDRTIVTTASATAGYAVCADTQKVDVHTIKTQTVTCGAGVTIRADVGHAGAPGAENGALTTNGTKINQTADLTAGQSIACSDKTGFSLSAAGIQAIWDALSSALTTVGSIGKRLVDYLTGDTFVRLGAPSGDSVSADIAAAKAQLVAIEADTQDLQAQIGTDGAGLTSIGDTRMANLDATVSSRLATAGYTAPPTTAQIKTAMELDGGKLDHLWEMTEDDAGVRRLTANALEEAPSGSGGDATEANQEIIIDALDTISGKVDGIVGGAPVNVVVQGTSVQVTDA